MEQVIDILSLATDNYAVIEAICHSILQERRGCSWSVHSFSLVVQAGLMSEANIPSPSLVTFDGSTGLVCGIAGFRNGAKKGPGGTAPQWCARGSARTHGMCNPGAVGCWRSLRSIVFVGGCPFQLGRKGIQKEDHDFWVCQTDQFAEEDRFQHPKAHQGVKLLQRFLVVKVSNSGHVPSDEVASCCFFRWLFDLLRGGLEFQNSCVFLFL